MINKNWKKLVTIIAVWIGLWAQGALAKDFCISAKGRDTNPGTETDPLASLQAAQREVRAYIKTGPREPVNIIIGGGTYYLDKPLSLTPEDSGTAEYPITWCAAKNEQVVLSGGIPISHARYVMFKMAEVLVSRSLFYEILERIKRLKPIPIGCGECEILLKNLFLNTRAVKVCQKVRSISVQMHEQPYIYGILRRTVYEMDIS